jgi:hypothetical protein
MIFLTVAKSEGMMKWWALKEAISDYTFYCRDRVHSILRDSKAIDFVKKNIDRSGL